MEQAKIDRINALAKKAKSPEGLTPEETAEARGHCPVCGKPVTIGVLHRVEALADRPEGARRPGAKPFEHLVPLPEVIAASEGGTAASGRVNAKYEALLRKLGPEFQILRETPLEDIAYAAGPLVAEGIRRMRTGAVRWEPGYDGAYGVLGLLAPEEREALRGAVAALPERERQVILLRYFRGMTQDRTAKVLGVSQVQVSRIERKAVEHLRERLGE